MKKIMILLCSLLVAFSLTSCKNNDDEDDSSQFENNGDITLSSLLGECGPYSLYRFQEKGNTESSHYGVFKGLYEKNLLIDLGTIEEKGFFFENDKYFSLGPYMVEYDLLSCDPSNPIKKTSILDSSSRINRVIKVTPELIFADVHLWDYENNRSEQVYLSIARDGTGYEIIDKSDIPK